MKFGSLQVRTPDGEQKEFPIDLPSLVVGRADGSNILIDDLSISRRHARLIIESGRLVIEDLGSAAGTYVGGHRIEPHTSNLVELTQGIRFGDVEVGYTPPAPGTTESSEPGSVDGVATGLEPPPSAAIRVSVVSPATPVDPGGAVFASATVHNRGHIVDLLNVTVTGIPATWVSISHPTFALVPGAQETITLIIQPPISPESLAGEYDFGVVVNSGELEREAMAFGKLVVLPFDATDLNLSPVRSKRDFTLVARNRGNAVVTYSLSGSDDEGTFLFGFHQPSIELKPGEERKVLLRIKRNKRQWFGRNYFLPFRVNATPVHGTSTSVETLGQLAVRPPLEKWKMPVLVLLLLAAIALGLWLSWIYRDEMPSWVPWSTKADAAAAPATGGEAAFAGIHMCDKPAEERPAVVPVTIPGGGSGAPLFAQNNPAWATVEYAKAGDPEFGPDWCGTTIEQCGCAMTSVTTVMALFNILTMPDGSELTPEAVNAWFNEEARKTSRGWVSKGYIYGDVIWAAANELSGQIARARPGTTTVRFAGFGSGSEEEVREQLRNGRPMVLEVPGHFIAAVGIDSDGETILINDPFYPDRTTYAAYAGKVKKSVLFEPSNDLSGVVITVPKDLKVRVVDSAGKVVGTVNTDPPLEDVEGAWFDTRDAWRDPTCIESPPPVGAGTTSIYLPGTADDYRVEVVNPGGGGSSVAIHSFDRNGNAALETQDATGQLVMALGFDPSNPAVQSEVLTGGSTPGGSETPDTEPTPIGGGGVPGGPGDGTNGQETETPTETPTPEETATPSPSPTPSPTPLPPPAPQSVQVACDIAYSPGTAGVTCNGNVTGTYTTTRWSVNGLPAPVAPGSTTFATTFSQNTAISVAMTACNITVCTTGSVGVAITFPSATPTPTTPTPVGTPTPTPSAPLVGPPAVVPLTCTHGSWQGGQVTISCSTTFTESFNNITWTTRADSNGQPGQIIQQISNGAKAYQQTLTTPGVRWYQVTVCLSGECTTSGPVKVEVGQGALESNWSVHVAPAETAVVAGEPLPITAFFDALVPNGYNPPGGIFNFFYAFSSAGPWQSWGSAPVQGSSEPLASTSLTVPNNCAQDGLSIYFTGAYPGDSSWLPWDGRSGGEHMSHWYWAVGCFEP